MLPLTGEYELTLDDKNRLSVPARVREQLLASGEGDRLYWSLGPNRILCLYTESQYQRIALAVAPGKAAPDELLAYERVGFALAGRVELDRQGRVLLNEKSLRRAGLRAQVTLIGARDHLELWNTEEWDRYVEEHLPMHEKMLTEARQESLHRARVEAGWK